ncbi:hypothetical protein IC006_1299 [Sulfuracidifex tepidarius]|uniref:Uncharacterized protein n=1 Tax=Sulfuracidifex tepidarius TaxID=1294262 RepID=A0A510E2M6_9CREN|nr:hypothetical protein IC006_1299 [Sulfuracidifex tepidarius]BBG26753.1 hypothetical protein IC007_1274 [Sulfuracidifex tepidarius]
MLVDIDWIYGKKINDEGLYEIYMGIPYTNNFEIAVANLSKTVEVEKVEVLEDAKVEPYIASHDGTIRRGSEEEWNDGENLIIYVPVFSKVVGYSWGDKYSKNLH